MLVLGLDTSSPAVSAALVDLDSGRTVAGSVVVDGRRHGELLAVGVRAVLAGTGRGQLRAVVVGLGPGPFTGLRVGLVTAAALADAWSLPVYGVCSLDAVVPEELADPAADVAADVAVVADARRREVYWASYAAGRRLEGPAVGRPAELADQLRSLPTPPVLVGPGAVFYREVFEGLSVLDGPHYPRVERLVGLASARIRGGAPSDPLTPLYLRRPDAVAPGVPKRVTA